MLYGVCISDIRRINEESAIELLKEISEKGYDDYLENFNENKMDNGNDYTFRDWISNFQSEFHGHGLPGFLVEIIEAIEEIDELHLHTRDFSRELSCFFV